MECTAQGLSCPWTNVLIMAPTSPARGQEAISLLESFVLRVSEGSGDSSQGREAVAYPFAGRESCNPEGSAFPAENQSHPTFWGWGEGDAGQGVGVRMDALPSVPAPQQ